MNILFIILIISGMTLAIVAFTFIMIWVLSRVFIATSGGSALAAKYPAVDPPQGQIFTGQTVRIGAVRYSRGTTMGISSFGFYVSVKAFIIATPPPLLIPWSEVRSVRKTFIRWLPGALLTIGDPPVGAISIPLAVLKEARRYLDHAVIDADIDSRLSEKI